MCAGMPLFPEDITDEEVVAMLLGYRQLPFEANPGLFSRMHAPETAQQLLRAMVARNPAERPTLEEVCCSADGRKALVPVLQPCILRHYPATRAEANA